MGDTKFSDQFMTAVLNMVRAEENPQAESVTSIETDTRDGGYCETCAYSYAVIEIYYQLPADQRPYDWSRECYVWEGDFGELIRKLDNYTEVQP